MRHKRGNGTIAPTSVKSSRRSVKLTENGQTAPAPGSVSASASSNEAPRGGFKFLSMFPGPSHALFKEEDLMELGRRMQDSPDRGDHPSLPAGYTYLGQFIAHDISFIQQNEIPVSPLPPDQIPQSRNPSLDLDSLYGNGPESIEHANLYEDDRASLKLGLTAGTGSGVTLLAYRNDLPRNADESSPEYRRAIIADERNDDNLIVAQTQVAFMKFHNAVVDELKGKGFSGNDLFVKARRRVVQHYQWIILNDYLPRIIDEAVLRKVIRKYPAEYFKLQPGQAPFIPAEFAFAAFRFGHSLVRNAYCWNRINDKIGLGRLFSLTGKNGNLEATKALSSDWIIDWTRFYDFSDFGIARNPKMNKARAIQASLADSFKNLRLRQKRFLNNIEPERYRSVAALDLIRGQRAGLLSGQEVAKQLSVRQLGAEDIAKGPHESFLRESGFDEQTPLWYYILKEAELSQDNRLGAVGSRIVAETFIGLIRASQFSILPRSGGKRVWKPDLGQRTQDHFEMADLLMFVRNNPMSQGYDALNPLGP